MGFVIKKNERQDNNFELPLGKCFCDVCNQLLDESESFSVTIQGTYKAFDTLVSCGPCVETQRVDFIGTNCSLKVSRRFESNPTFAQTYQKRYPK